MTDLLRFALDAHGSLDRWRAASQIKAHVSVGGTMWARKGHPGVLDDVDEVVLDPHREWITYTPFITPGQRSVFEPDRNVIETLDGEVIEERLNPRVAFASHTA